MAFLFVQKAKSEIVEAEKKKNITDEIRDAPDKIYRRRNRAVET
jgi:hypothetical protein